MMGCRARKQSADESTASARPSIAEGAVGGAVKPCTVTCGGRLVAILRRHALVMVSVELGLMSRMDIGRVEAPVTHGRRVDDMAVGDEFKTNERQAAKVPRRQGRSLCNYSQNHREEK